LGKSLAERGREEEEWPELRKRKFDNAGKKERKQRPSPPREGKRGCNRYLPLKGRVDRFHITPSTREGVPPDRATRKEATKISQQKKRGISAAISPRGESRKKGARVAVLSVRKEKCSESRKKEKKKSPYLQKKET